MIATMGSAKASLSLLIVVAFFLALAATSSAFNITKVLADYPQYGTFKDLLNQTKLAAQITQRQTITVLALDNDAVSSIAGRPADELRNILMNHVILDYFDLDKIRNLGKKSAILTTLYQTTGVAENQQGFLNLTRIAPGNVVFGSAVKGAPLVSKLLGSVVSQPFNLSVLHVSTPIVAPGFGDPVLAPPPPPGSQPPAPAPKKAGKAPAPSEESDDEEEAAAPDSAHSPAPSNAPADAPIKGKTPPAPKDADEEDDAPAPSASSRVGSSVAVAVLMGLVASLAAF